MSAGRAGNHRSSIYRDPKGVWHGWVTMGRDDSGETVRRHVRGKNATDVGEKVAQLESQRTGAAGRAAVSAKATVGDWIDEWLRIFSDRERRGPTSGRFAGCGSTVVPSGGSP